MNPECTGHPCTCAEARARKYTRMGMLPRRSMIAMLVRCDPLSLCRVGMCRGVRGCIYGLLNRCDIYAIMCAGGICPDWRALICARVYNDPFAQWIVDRVYFGKAKLRQCDREVAKFKRVEVRDDEILCNQIVWGHVDPKIALDRKSEKVRFAVFYKGVYTHTHTHTPMFPAVHFDRDVGIDVMPHVIEGLVFILHARELARSRGLYTRANLEIALSYGSVEMIIACAEGEPISPNTAMGNVMTNKLNVIKWAYAYTGAEPQHVDLRYIRPLAHTDVEKLKWGISIGAHVHESVVLSALYTCDITIVEFVASNYVGDLRPIANEYMSEYSEHRDIIKTTRAVIEWCKRVLSC